MKTNIAEDGRVFQRLEHVEVWVCVETGEAFVFGDPGSVEPEGWEDESARPDGWEDDPRSHNCDAAQCATFGHRVVEGRIAGRGSDREAALAKAALATAYGALLGARDVAEALTGTKSPEMDRIIADIGKMVGMKVISASDVKRTGPDLNPGGAR